MGVVHRLHPYRSGPPRRLLVRVSGPDAMKNGTFRRRCVPCVCVFPCAGPCQWNVDDRVEFIAVSPDGLMCQARDPVQWGGVRGTVGLSGGTAPPFPVFG